MQSLIMKVIQKVLVLVMGHSPHPLVKVKALLNEMTLATLYMYCRLLKTKSWWHVCLYVCNVVSCTLVQFCYTYRYFTKAS